MIYLAAPLFNERERIFNLELARCLAELGEVFLPQRDGYLLTDMLIAGVSLEVAEQRVFSQDRAAMARSDLLIAVLDGAHIDEGVAFEIGFSHALGKMCLGLQTDVRRALPTGNNPMIERSLNAIAHDTDELITLAQTTLAANARSRSGTLG